jgi:hypothetical protein
MTTTREFHIGGILSITTGCLVSPRRMEGVYDILNFLSGDNLMTHQLPRVSREMAPRLKAQHPQLATISGDDVTSENHGDWLAARIAEFGEALPVRTEHQFHEIKNPIAEAEEMIGADRVIVVES